LVNLLFKSNNRIGILSSFVSLVNLRFKSNNRIGILSSFVSLVNLRFKSKEENYFIFKLWKSLLKIISQEDWIVPRPFGGAFRVTQKGIEKYFTPLGHYPTALRIKISVCSSLPNLKICLSNSSNPFFL